MKATILTEIYDYKEHKPTVKINNKVVTEDEYCNRLYYFYWCRLKPKVQINRKGNKRIYNYTYYEEL